MPDLSICALEQGIRETATRKNEQQLFSAVSLHYFQRIGTEIEHVSIQFTFSLRA